MILDPDLEVALLCSCLLSERALEDASRIVSHIDFVARPSHSDLFRAMVECAQVGERDPLDIVKRANSQMVTVELIQEIMLSPTPSTSMASRYATQLASVAARYRMAMLLGDCHKILDEVEEPEAARDQIIETLRDVRLPATEREPALSAFDLIQMPIDYDWLIPGWLERRDRILLTGGEGAGKSFLALQLAVQMAAGIHPWTYEDVPPIKVLVVDLENQERQISRRLRQLYAPVRTVLQDHHLNFRFRTDGIDITHASDQRWLIDELDAARPDLLVIGPLYKMTAGVQSKGDVGGEDYTRQIIRFLDRIRERNDLALLIETHTPHGDSYQRSLRPFGSSVWMRWPEFGVGIRLSDDAPNVYDFVHWRPGRDQRLWPDKLQRSTGSWPWVPIMPTGTFR